MSAYDVAQQAKADPGIGNNGYGYAGDGVSGRTGDPDEAPILAGVWRPLTDRDLDEAWFQDARAALHRATEQGERLVTVQGVTLQWSPVEPDSGNPRMNHYDWFMPTNPTAAVDDYLDDFEAKMREALTDPFVHDMAQAVLPLIAAYREARRPS